MNLTETIKRQSGMRSDYGLYVVAVICFIIAGVFLTSAFPGYTLADPMGTAAIAIFLVLGIIFAAAGYTMRPKVAVPTPTLPPPSPAEPTPTPPPPLVEEAPVAPLPAEEQVPSVPLAPPPTEEVAPTPAPTLEEPVKVEEEKPVRRRRRKKAT